MIRVTYVISDLEAGGAETQLLHFLRHLDRERLEPSVVYLFGTGTLASAVRDLDIQVHTVGLKRWNFPAAATRLLGLLRKTRPQILHLHLTHATVLGIVLSRTFGIGRCVVTRHFAGAGRRGFVYGLERRLLPYASRVIAVSDFVGRDVESLPGIRSGKVVTIPNGLDLEWFDARAEDAVANAGWPERDEGELRIGALANWREGKGLDRLLRAYSVVRSKIASARLWIGGDAPEATTGVGIEGVTWLGTLPHTKVPAFLRHVDVLAHPAEREAFGLAILEGMAASRPVVALRSGGIAELVSPDETGFLVDAREPDTDSALAEKVCDLLEDPHLRERMGASGRERAEKMFSMHAAVRRAESVYEEISSQTPG
jgi:glycosyltransferase involved in cell wall biosynthesis